MTTTGNVSPLKGGEFSASGSGTYVGALRAFASGATPEAVSILGNTYGTGVWNFGVKAVASGVANHNIGLHALAFNGLDNWAGIFESRLGVFTQGADEYDPDGDTLVVLDSNSAGGGTVKTWGPNGFRNVLISGQAHDANFGTISILNDAGQSRVSMFVDPYVYSGTVSTRGPNGSGNVVLGANGNNVDKGYLSIKDDAGVEQIALYVDEPDGDGLIVADQLIINENTYGDLSALLPDNSISSDEVLDEPGIAHTTSRGANVDITGSTTMKDVVTVEITTPTPGYIVVEASAQARFSNTTGANYMALQIDYAAGGSEINSFYHYAGFSTSAPSGMFWIPVSARRTFWEGAAGTFTYRLEARDKNGAGSKAMWNPTITAHFFPTSYGTVSTVVSSSEAGQFTDAQPVFSERNGQGSASGSTAGYVVDLRDLELKAARLRTEAAQAERDLIQAQMRVAETSKVME